MTQQLKDFLTKEGYFNLVEIPGRGICGLYRFVFTVGLVIGINEDGYKGRFCYPHLADAMTDINTWDGINDPSGDWLKYKGEDNEYSNQKLKDEKN